MKEKSYRVYTDLTEKAQEKKLEFMKENNREITERDMINALISAGLKKAKTKDIQEYIDSLGK